MFTYGSVCSGIEAVSVAWHKFATPVWFSEIEPFPCAVLVHHFPTVPNIGDMTLLAEKIRKEEVVAPDVLVGGTPCQAFSIAGTRRSLEDERGNLTLALIHIVEAIDYVRFKQGKEPCILVWENVPGVLSTKDNAFGHLLGGLAQESEPLRYTGKRWSNAGYVHSKRTISWRILNAQYFGVAQRRKRVFLVASARERSTAEILFEQRSVPGDTQPGGETTSGTTAFAESSFAQYSQSIVGGTLRAKGGTLGGGSENLIVHGTQDPIVNSNIAHCLGRNGGSENVIFHAQRLAELRLSAHISPTLTTRMGTGGNNVPCISIAGNVIGRKPSNGGNGKGYDDSGICYTLTTADVHGVQLGYTVRKLTPVECERLQGFPDNWTKIPFRNKPQEECPDSPRYKALGNSMAVPVMEWIGLRVLNYLQANA